MLICKFCGKECKNDNSLRNHERVCYENPNRQIPKGGRKVGCPAWNKGLDISDERVRRNSESASKTFQKQIDSGVYVPRRMGLDARRKLSEKQSLNNSGGKCKWFEIEGKFVQGTYELLFAKSLQTSKIEWEKVKTNNHIFKYRRDGKERSYAPDFYLPEYNLYIEIKGFWWGNDEDKMSIIREQHSDKRLIVIFGKDKLDYLCKDLAKRLPLEPVWSW